jgi:hypothetical protein
MDGSGRTENALGVEVGGDEAALALEGLLGGETTHVGHLHDVLQILIYIPAREEEKQA